MSNTAKHRTVIERAEPELVEAMDQKRIAIHNAAYLARNTPKWIQTAVVKPQHTKRDISRIVGEIRGRRATIPTETPAQAIQALLRFFTVAELRAALNEIEEASA